MRAEIIKNYNYTLLQVFAPVSADAVLLDHPCSRITTIYARFLSLSVESLTRVTQSPYPEF